MEDIKISVITATYNAQKYLPRLIESLENQTDKDFEWVVADGASTDGTLEILESAKKRLKNVIIDSRPDFGIYDALNRAVKLSSGDYYLVLGADDTLFPDAIENYKKAARHSKADLITAKIKVGNSILGPRYPSWEWLYGQGAYVSGHAVGLLIKKELHNRFGYYSWRFPIAADQFFILSAIHGGATLKKVDFVAGEFSFDGTTGNDKIGAIVDFFRVQVEISGSVALQTLLFVLRLIKNFRKIKKIK